MKPTFEQYLEGVIKILMNKASMDEATAKTHVEGMDEFFRDCYDDNVSAEDAVAEDMAEWEYGGEDEI